MYNKDGVKCKIRREELVESLKSRGVKEMNYRQRKLVMAIVIVSLALSFSGCKNNDKLGQPSQEPTTVNNSEVSPQISQEPSTVNNSEVSPQISQEPSIVNDSKETPLAENKTVNFSTFEVNKKYFNDAKGFVELRLDLPKLDGNYDGIPEINKYFVNKEKFFYDELPLDDLIESNAEVKGEQDNWYRSAEYSLTVVFGNIISMEAYLNGGAGGVGWNGIEGDTFDLNTGKKLSLQDIFKVSKDEYMNFIYDFVSKKVMDEINKDKESRNGYMFDDAYSGEGYKSIRNFNPDDFYLSKKALVVFYQKYVLADGAAGPLVFEIPYESISDILAINVNK